MDYQIVPKTHNHFLLVISLLIFSFLPYCLCIVNRDLVLTPKQGLQLSGKRIFYEESFNSDDNNNDNALHHNDSAAVLGTQPWERTLKHVTYLTLFTNAANGIITGNFSKVKEYNEFLASDYVHSPKPLDSRFGDIVTLAQGRLETMPNGSYRFVEGNCDYECARESNIIAMWHVQKIRHRDTADRKYHYEMKFSVSPMTSKAPTETVVRGGPNKRTIMEERRNNVQTFIQKEDDYPNSFRKLVSDKDEDFSDKRYEAARNFRQVSPHYASQQVTPIPQSTFLRGVYHPPPPPPHSTMHMQQLQHSRLSQQPSVHAHHPQLHHPQQHLPLPERLNIGEFYKGNYVPKTTSKMELFPNLLNMFMGKPQYPLPPPTTFRPPTYQMKFPRPEIYTLQHHPSQEFPKYSEYPQHPPPPPQSHSQEQFTQRPPTSMPVVTHHYHHHYFMPNNSAITIEQAIQHSSGEQNPEAPAELYHNEVTEITAPQGYVTNLYEEPHATTTLRQQHFPQPQHSPQTQYHANIQHQQTNRQNYLQHNYHFPQVVPPAPQKIVFPSTQIEQQRVVLVTPAPPLRKPQYQPQQQHQQQLQHYKNRPFTASLEYTTVHVPLLISYPATISEEERADVPTPRNKPFLQSDPLDDNVHYSEPDPLYANVNEAESGEENKFIANVQHSQQKVGNQEPQLESPENYDHQQTNQQQNDDEHDSKKEHSESIEAQLPAPNEKPNDTEAAKDTEETTETKQKVAEQNTSESTTTTIKQISNEKTTAKSIKTEASNSIVSATKRPKLFPLRSKRISLKTATTTSSTTTTAKPTTSPKPTTETIKSSTTPKPRKTFVSTSSTETPLRTVSRYRNTYTRGSSTTTTEKPVLKWTPKRKFNKFMTIKSTTPAAKENKIEINETDDESDENNDNNDEENNNNNNEDIKTNESNNIRITKLHLMTTTTENELDSKTTTTTEMSNAITMGTRPTVMASTTTTSSTSSSTSTTISPLLSQTSQAETEIYEILTQKSVSKSVSLKVGNNGEEIPVIIDDHENEVKTF
ncbi:transcription activator MSS11 [Lucilia sericata]|uniref:transcription activator MSS11 n=1 Tax=Lucilia sericata TaxID=13632 RepID=UPI0018A801D4|nr:transcription activator MSS11 [Lucilia sericata]